MKVLVTTMSFLDTPGPHHEMLAQAGCELVRNPAGKNMSEEQMVAAIADVDGVILGVDPCTRRVIAAARKLQVISRYGVGLDNVDLAAAKERGIPVTWTPGVNEITVAELALGFMFSLARKIPQSTATLKGGQWKRQTGVELAGKTLGILGLGRVGKQLARRARGLDMAVIAFDIFWSEQFARQHGIQKAGSPEEVLKSADFVSLHMNLSDETREIINAQTLALMKPGAYLINAARAQLVNSADLVKALTHGKIAGYGTDVFDEEPPSAGEPLLKLENVVCTPHLGSRTTEAVLRQAAMATENLIAVLEGREPLALVET